MTDYSIINQFLAKVSHSTPSRTLWLGVSRLTNGWNFNEDGFDQFIDTIQNRTKLKDIFVIRIYCAETWEEIFRMRDHLYSQIANGIVVKILLTGKAEPPDLSIIYKFKSEEKSEQWIDEVAGQLGNQNALKEFVGAKFENLCAFRFNTKSGIFLKEMQFFSEEDANFRDLERKFFDAYLQSESLDREWLHLDVQLKKQGFAILPEKISPLTTEDWEELEATICKSVYEKIDTGDTNESVRVQVARYIVDRKEHEENQAKNKHIYQYLNRNLLSRKKVSNFFDKLLNTKAHVLRCQSNFYETGSHVSKHTDGSSNPLYEITVILYFSDPSYLGGELLVNEQKIRPEKRTILVLGKETEHEVREVKKGERRAILFFLSKFPPLKRPEVGY